MPVKIEEYVTILDVEGNEKDGKAVATNLTAIENPEGGFFFGSLKQITKVHTTIVCDNDKCEHGTVDDTFHTNPKTIEFDDKGGQPEAFVKDIAEVVITSDFTGRKLVFCSLDCLTAYSKRTLKKASVVEMPSGKGKRTFNHEPTITLKENNAGESEVVAQSVDGGTEG